jgi:hypothetical protein
MTVCTASMFYWNYSLDPEKPDWGPAFIVASDRMMTELNFGIEYQSSRWKALIFGPTHMVLVAGDMTFHSDVLSQLGPTLGTEPHTPKRIAEIVGDLFVKVRRERLAKRFLAPLNLTTEQFISEQSSLAPELVLDLAGKLHAERYDTEAIVVGCSPNENGLFRVDEFGTVTSHLDIGFLSIGIGGIHASAQFMDEPYTYDKRFHAALYSTFLAKKRAEVAPGVGPITDIFRINRDAIVKIPDELVAALDSLYISQRKSSARTAFSNSLRLVEAEKKWFAAHPPTAPSSENSN